MSDDLVARLRHAWDERERQLDEDERVALEAAAGNDGGANWAIDPPDPRESWARPRLFWLAVTDSTDPATMPPAMAEHIARHDPARVLAEVERGRRDIAAKRRILDESQAVREEV